MLKKSTLALSVLGLATVQAQSQLSSCDLAGNCTGFFYEDINAAFVDCFDMNGVLLSRKENFFTSALQKECNSTDYAHSRPASTALSPWSALLPTRLSNSATTSKLELAINSLKLTTASALFS